MSNSALLGIKIELEKIKGITEKLESEIIKEKPDVQNCRKMLVELQLSITKITGYLHFILPSPRIEMETKLLKQLTDIIYGIIDAIEDPSVIKSKNFRKLIIELISIIHPIIIYHSSTLSLPLTTTYHLQELINMHELGLNENWLVSICYLSAMEIIVNKKLKELNIEFTGKDFAWRFKILLEYLEKTKNIKIGELNKVLSHSFWEIRNKVVHEGYNPTEEELNLIISWVKKIIKFLI